jgi:hypothetical protein
MPPAAKADPILRIKLPHRNFLHEVQTHGVEYLTQYAGVEEKSWTNVKLEAGLLERCCSSTYPRLLLQESHTNARFGQLQSGGQASRTGANDNNMRSGHQQP